jgi:hypothetical protein
MDDVSETITASYIRAKSIIYTSRHSENIKFHKQNSGNACYFVVQNVLTSKFLQKKVKMKKYKTVIFVMGVKPGHRWSQLPVWGIGIDRFDAETVYSYPVKGMGVCHRLDNINCCSIIYNIQSSYCQSVVKYTIKK